MADRRRERIVRLDDDHGYPNLPLEQPDYLRIFYAARRMIVNAARRPKPTKP